MSYKLIELEEQIEKLSRKIEQLRESIQVPVAPGEVVPLGRVRLSVNFLELTTALIFNGLAEGKTLGQPYTVAAGSILTVDYAVSKNKVIVPTTWRLVVDTDHALSAKIFMDDRPVFQDTDIVQANYAYPYTFYDMGGTTPVTRYLRFIVTNKTTSDVNLNIVISYVEADRKIFEDVLRKYFETVLKEVGR